MPDFVNNPAVRAWPIREYGSLPVSPLCVQSEFVRPYFGAGLARVHHRHGNSDTLFHSGPQCVQSRDSDFDPFDRFPEGVFRCLTKQSQAS